MKKVNEIFYSLQGEGAWTGTPIVFVRFSGCNLACSFCDTAHEAGQEMTDDEIIEAVSQYPSKRICFTGGEPALQLDQALVNALKAKDFILHIETNGTRLLPDGLDWITVSPKYKEVVLPRADELKLVYEGQDPSPWLEYPASSFFLQPCSMQNTEEVIEYIKQHPTWRLSLQTHKLLDIR